VELVDGCDGELAHQWTGKESDGVSDGDGKAGHDYEVS